MSTDIRLLRRLLWQYQMDAPYIPAICEDGESPDRNARPTDEQIEQWLAEDHYGDCTNACSSCTRCAAEEIDRMARWLATHLDAGGAA